MMDHQEHQRHDQFLRLYVANEEDLRGFVRSLVPTREDAREVMQETAAVLWRKFDQLETPGDFRRWAFGVARFEALAFRRDRARDRHVFSEDLIAMLSEEAEQVADRTSSEERALRSCLKKLPGKQRILIESAYANGVRIDQLAEDLGRTPMSLYKALHRIRIALADCIQGYLKTEEARG